MKMTKEEVLAKLPNYFWGGFLGELVGVFGIDILDVDDEGMHNINYYDSTCGWVMAFRMTCYKLDMMWLREWHDAMDLMESDDFDGELVNGLIARFASGVEFNESPYSKHLHKRFKDVYVP